MSDQLKDPREMKAAIVEQYHANSRRMGLEVSGADLERIAAADLQAVERYEAGRKVAPAAKPAAPDPNRRNKAAEFAASKGAKFTRSNQVSDSAFGDLIMNAKPKTMSPRFDAMMARAFRIMRPNENVAERGVAAMAKASDTPAMAKEMLAEFMNYKLWHMAPGKNPYFVQSAKDRAKIFIRRVEDICDRSTAFYGPWWTR